MAKSPEETLATMIEALPEKSSPGSEKPMKAPEVPVSFDSAL